MATRMYSIKDRQTGKDEIYTPKEAKAKLSEIAGHEITGVAQFDGLLYRARYEINSLDPDTQVYWTAKMKEAWDSARKKVLRRIEYERKQLSAACNAD